MVLMDFDVRAVQSHASMLGFDAISTYALPGGTQQVNQISFKQNFYGVLLRAIFRALHMLSYFVQLKRK